MRTSMSARIQARFYQPLGMWPRCDAWEMPVVAPSDQRSQASYRKRLGSPQVFGTQAASHADSRGHRGSSYRKCPGPTYSICSGMTASRPPRDTLAHAPPAMSAEEGRPAFARRRVLPGRLVPLKQMDRHRRRAGLLPRWFASVYRRRRGSSPDRPNRS